MPDADTVSDLQNRSCANADRMRLLQIRLGHKTSVDWQPITVHDLCVASDRNLAEMALAINTDKTRKYYCALRDARLSSHVGCL